MHGIGLVKYLTLRTGLSSEHLKNYNNKDYMGSALDQVISGNYMCNTPGVTESPGQRSTIGPTQTLC